MTIRDAQIRIGSRPATHCVCARPEESGIVDVGESKCVCAWYCDVKISAMVECQEGALWCCRTIERVTVLSFRCALGDVANDVTGAWSRWSEWALGLEAGGIEGRVCCIFILPAVLVACPLYARVATRWRWRAVLNRYSG